MLRRAVVVLFLRQSEEQSEHLAMRSPHAAALRFLSFWKNLTNMPHLEIRVLNNEQC